MADVVTLERDAGGVFSKAASLDGLWAQAETLGKVSVEAGYGDGYSATVQFKTASGSHVFAKATAKRPADALRAAIFEAERLGATSQ